MGICHNNLANLAGQDKDVRVTLGLEPQHHFDQAIANAREQPHGSPATLATRLLNCALWHMREGRVEKACECLAWGPAGSCVASCGADAKTLAAIAVTCTRNIGSAQLQAKEEAYARYGAKEEAQVLMPGLGLGSGLGLGIGGADTDGEALLWSTWLQLLYTM